jgi:hypothetical protein
MNNKHTRVDNKKQIHIKITKKETILDKILKYKKAIGQNMSTECKETDFPNL